VRTISVLTGFSWTALLVATSFARSAAGAASVSPPRDAQASDGANAADAPDAGDTPDTAGAPHAADTPDTAGAPHAADTPDTAGAPHAADTPDTAAVSDTVDPELEFESTAQVDAPPREVTRHTLTQSALLRVPGTRGDALRAVELMPGVARARNGQADPILRGASALESQTFLDGSPVPFLYHFGGLTSFISSRMVEKLDVYPGNFSARYGRVGGGVVEVTLRDPATDRLHGGLDLNFIDSSLYVEAPASKKLAVAAAVRRSNIDLVFDKLVPKDAYNVVAAPVYYDYQTIATYRPTENTRLRVLGYGSRDSLRLFFANPNQDDPALAGSISGEVEFHRLGAELSSRADNGASGTVSFNFARIDAAKHIGGLSQIFGGYEFHSRAEGSFEFNHALRLTSGVDAFAQALSGSYRGPQPGSAEGNPRDNDPLAAQRSVSVKSRPINLIRPAAYVELGVRPTEALLLTPGVRLDYLGDVKQWTLDPRLSARYELNPATAFKAGVGYFTQAPEFYQSLSEIGNPHIDPYHTLQVSGGAEQKLGDQIQMGAEAFFKRQTAVVVGTADGQAPHFENAGQGRIYGAELSTEAHWAGQGLGYVAYTLSRSERRVPGEVWRLFDTDQTHVLTLAASQGLGRGWDVGLRLRVVSGNPNTPVVGATYDARSGVYVPEYTRVNSGRDPLFHQLDLRVEKAWTFGEARLALYLDLQNAYNAKNPEGYRYNFDYSKKEAVTGLPLFPNLGLRGDL